MAEKLIASVVGASTLTMKNNLRNYEKLINELEKIKKYNKMTEVERSQVAEDIVSFCEIIASIAINEVNNISEERRKKR